MKDRYSYRPYDCGDAEKINQLYYEVTGRRRTVEQFEWQWLRAPGGPGDIWLIETAEARSGRRLIGHHGIMPIRFTNGSENLLVGKTENTMIHPAYRGRLLYVRFERRFAARYETRFDALFSTRGPDAAIRLRRAMGYEFPSVWRNFKIGTGPLSDLYHFFAVSRERLMGKLSSRKMFQGALDELDLSSTIKSSQSLRALKDSEARQDAFFIGFWSAVRSAYGMTPRRDREDLDWRFWSNPYSRYLTLISDSGTQEAGFVILRTSPRYRAAAVIEDIVPAEPTSESFCVLLDSVRRWVYARGLRWLHLSITEEACMPGQIARGLTARSLKLPPLLRGNSTGPGARTARKITDRGRAASVPLEHWYVTPLVLEGRR